MLNQLNINNYKSLNSCFLEFKSLNLLAGANSSGKSSVLQAILIAADNVSQHKGRHGLVNIRTSTSNFNEVRNFLTNAKSYEISISCNKSEKVDLHFIPGDDLYQTTDVEQKNDANNKLLELLKDGNILYLPATRPGGIHIQPINPDTKNKLGNNGEFIFDYYAKHRLDVLDDTMLLTKNTQTYEGQVNYQLEKLTDYKLLVETIGSNHYINFETKTGKKLLPHHVGTGVSFIAEVIISCFATPKSGVIIIENPEIHLHPKAQADLIDFFVDITKMGIQVILESHSDHIFNGIRRLISKGKLPLSDVSVYNFRKDDTGVTLAENVEFTNQGGLLKYIPGMFEQFDNDLDAILNL